LAGIRIAPVKSGLHRLLNRGNQRIAYYIDPEGAAKELPGRGSQEHQTQLYLLISVVGKNDPLKMRSFDQLLQEDIHDFVPQFSKLVKSLEQLKKQFDLDLDQETLKGLFLDQHGGVYLLQPEICKLIEETQPPMDTPSGLSAEEELVYRLLFHLYKKIGGSGDESLVHPFSFEPRLRRELAQLLYRVLLRRETADLGTLSRTLRATVDLGVFETMVPADVERRRREGEKLSRRERRRSRKKEFLRKLLPRTALVGAGLLILLFLFYPWIKKSLSPSPLEGLEARQVIELFFESYNNLDSETMSICTTDGAARQLIDRAAQLYVIEKVRRGVEQRQVFLKAEEWIAQGKPELSADRFVFGTSDLRIRALSPPQSWEAEYRLWMSQTPDPEDEDAPLLVEEKVVKTRIEMQKTRKGWQIASFESSGS